VCSHAMAACAVVVASAGAEGGVGEVESAIQLPR
jgi:hypothetical protein